MPKPFLWRDLDKNISYNVYRYTYNIKFTFLFLASGSDNNAEEPTEQDVEDSDADQNYISDERELEDEDYLLQYPAEEEEEEDDSIVSDAEMRQEMEQDELADLEPARPARGIFLNIFMCISRWMWIYSNYIYT